MKKKANFFRQLTNSVIPLDYIIDYWNMDGNSNGYNGNNGSDTSVSYPSGFINESADYTFSNASITQVSNSSQVFSFGDGSTDSAFSVSCWVNFSTVTNAFLVSIRLAGFLDWDIFQTSNTIRTRLYSQNSGSTYKQVTKSQTWSTGTWYHICLTYSGTGYQTLYINGSSTGNSTTTNGTYVAMQGAGGELQFGRVSFSTIFSLNGYLDEIVICNVELSASEVTDLYNAGLAGTPII